MEDVQKRIGAAGAGGVMNCLAEIVGEQGYESFGSLLPGRNYSATTDSYRFGFQGQESDGEINGERNSYAFEYRIHDPRVGRFLSIDPLAADYPWNSPYAFSENRVIDGVDFEGSEYMSYMKLIDHRTPGDITSVGVHGHNMIRGAYNSLAGGWNLGVGLVTGDIKPVPGVWQYQVADAMEQSVSTTVDAFIYGRPEDVDEVGAGLILAGAGKALTPLSKSPLKKVTVGDIAPDARYSGRYSNGQRAHRTNVPRDRFNEPAIIQGPEAPVGPHSQLQFDAVDPSKIYSATEFNKSGQAMFRVDLAGRSGDLLPHRHEYNPATQGFGKEKLPIPQTAPYE